MQLAINVNTVAVTMHYIHYRFEYRFYTKSINTGKLSNKFPIEL